MLARVGRQTLKLKYTGPCTHTFTRVHQGTTMTRLFSSSCPSLQQTQTTDQSPSAPLKQDLPSEKDQELDEWFAAIKRLEQEYNNEINIDELSKEERMTSTLIRRSQEKDLIEDLASSKDKKFIPTEEQVKQWSQLQGVPIPERHQDPVLQHVINMIMHHGKRQKATTIVSQALYIVFLELRQDPVQVLKHCLDVLAPLVVVKTHKGGNKAVSFPVPLSKKQRDRKAWMWIVEGSGKRPSKKFSIRLAEEIIAAYKGTSTGFDKRDAMHKAAILNRSYIVLK